MSINILETKTGFNYNKENQEYLIGESLVELANYDFTELDDLLFNFKEKTNLTYKDYFNSIFQLNYHSIHFQLLKNTLLNFYENFDDSTPLLNSVPFPFSTISNQDELNGEITLFFSSLFSMQNRIKKILTAISSSNNTNKISTLSKLAKKEPELFDFRPRNTNTIYRQYDYIFYEPPLFSNGEISFNLQFWDIETFCVYELKRLLDSSVKIIFCPTCKKFYIAHDQRQIYCSPECKRTENKKHPNTNKFYELYRKRYKYLHAYYTGPTKNSESIPKEICESLKSLYNEYKTKNENDLKVIKKFENKLKCIK